MSTPLYLIDASIPFFRYYFSMPDHWVSPCGQSAAGVYGFSHWLKRFLHDAQPQYIAACFDESLGNGFRNQLFSGYKARRPLPDQNITWQLNSCKDICRSMGVPVYASSTFEADDLIATLAQKHRSAGGHCTVISRDKDLMQVVREYDQFWNYPDDAPLDYAGCTQKMGVKPEQIPHYLALVGDPIDDIPGVPGIGKKTAQFLLKHFKDLPALYKNADQLCQLELRGAKTLKQKLMTHRTQIDIALQLASVVTDAPLGRRFEIKKLPVEKQKLQALAEASGFKIKL